ncbi:MAG: serine/threonine protein kinase [Dokdonella sp.]
MESAWRRYRNTGGRDEGDGFVAWVMNGQPTGTDPLHNLADEPVEVTRILPMRFATHCGDAATRVMDGAGVPAEAVTAKAQQARPEFPYVLLGNAGRGGMGTVHVARDTELARRVALKELNADVRDVDGIRERFIREAQITAQLDHPNVVPVYALEMTPEGMPAYTMKFVQGKTFQTLIDETQDAFERGETPDEAHSQATRLEHFLKVADAMAYAHDKGVIHRDLKPANLMLGRHNEVYVMDWGLCRLLNQPEAPTSPDASWVLSSANVSGRSSETQAGDLIGTPRYMSPEQAGARNLEIDARSDQYALGLILYEMVTLQTPYEGSSAYDVLMNARVGQRRAVTGAYRGMHIARELRAIIERATRMSPTQRYANVADFAAEIRRFVRGEAVFTAPDTPWQRLQRGIVRHRQQASIGILALVALSAIAVGGLLWQNQRVIERENLREQRTLMLREAVADAGDHIQTRLLQLEGALSDLASSTEQALQYALPSDEPVYLLRDFSDPARAPTDLQPAPEFGGHMSLHWPVWVLPSGVDEPAAMVRVRRLANLQEFYGELYRRIQSVVRGDSKSFYSTLPVAASNNFNEVIVAGILLGLDDGIGSLYPGWDGIAPGFDPRTTDWYRIAVNQHNPRWGEPSRIVQSGPPVLPLSIPLYDRAQHFLGVLSLTVVSQRFLHDLLDLGKVPGVESVLLTDAHGDLLATAHRDHQTTSLNSSDSDTAKAVLARLQDSNDSVVTMDIAGHSRFIVADNIDPLGWTLIAITQTPLVPDR